MSQQGLSIAKKDTKLLWRSPVIWLVLSLVSFILAWLVWQMIDKYVSLQASFSALPNPPNITESLWIPFLLTLAKLMLLIIALTTGLALAQERSQKTMWYLLINKPNQFSVIWQKFKAQCVVFGFIGLQLIILTSLLATGGFLQWTQIIWGMVGFLLFVVWYISLGLLVSSITQSTGAAVLLNVVIFVMLWMISGESVGQEFGLNWLHLLSPVHHLKWFCQGVVGLSSMIYFIAGSICFLWIAANNLESFKSK